MMMTRTRTYHVDLLVNRGLAFFMVILSNTGHFQAVFSLNSFQKSVKKITKIESPGLGKSAPFTEQCT